MEKRLYQRVLVNLVSNFIVNKPDLGYKEFGGFVEDVSENGMKIRVEDKKYFPLAATIKIGDKISFQAVDEYKLYNKTRIDVFTGEALVVRVNKIDEAVSFGCRVIKPTEEFGEYVKNKKMALFMDIK